MADESRSTLEQPTTFKEGGAGVMRHVRPYRRITTLLIVFGLISAMANGVVPYVTGLFFDALIALSQGRHTFALGFPAWMTFLAIWAVIQALANGIDWIEDRKRREIDSKL